MIIITDEMRKKIEQHQKEKKDEDFFNEINSNPMEKPAEKKTESKKELQKLTEEQKKKIMDVLNDFSSVYFVDESPESEYITEYDILMKQKEEEWKLHFLEDNKPSEIEAILKMCDMYMEDEKNGNSLNNFGAEFGFIMNFDMWLNNSLAWPVMYNPEWEEWEKLKEKKVKRKDNKDNNEH
ncbi:hypothetical protein R84B8_02520 [Treponema sp. R8-4-B8]